MALCAVAAAGAELFSGVAVRRGGRVGAPSMEVALVEAAAGSALYPSYASEW